MSYVCDLIMQYSLSDRLKSSVRSSKDVVFLRSDFGRFGDYRQVTRALGELEKDGVLVRAGYGIDTKPDATSDIAKTLSLIKQRLGLRLARQRSFQLSISQCHIRSKRKIITMYYLNSVTHLKVL